MNHSVGHKLGSIYNPNVTQTYGYFISPCALICVNTIYVKIRTISLLSGRVEIVGTKYESLESFPTSLKVSVSGLISFDGFRF